MRRTRGWDEADISDTSSHSFNCPFVSRLQHLFFLSFQHFFSVPTLNYRLSSPVLCWDLLWKTRNMDRKSNHCSHETERDSVAASLLLLLCVLEGVQKMVHTERREEKQNHYLVFRSTLDVSLQHLKHIEPHTQRELETRTHTSPEDRARANSLFKEREWCLCFKQRKGRQGKEKVCVCLCVCVLSWKGKWEESRFKPED